MPCFISGDIAQEKQQPAEDPRRARRHRHEPQIRANVFKLSRCSRCRFVNTECPKRPESVWIIMNWILFLYFLSIYVYKFLVFCSSVPNMTQNDLPWFKLALSLIPNVKTTKQVFFRVLGCGSSPLSNSISLIFSIHDSGLVWIWTFLVCVPGFGSIPELII